MLLISLRMLARARRNLSYLAGADGMASHSPLTKTLAMVIIVVITITIIVSIIITIIVVIIVIITISGPNSEAE